MEPPPTPTNLNPNHRLTKPRYGASTAMRALGRPTTPQCAGHQHEPRLASDAARLHCRRLRPVHSG